MSRLIDADKINPMRCPRSIAEMREWIDEQPTAYDIDKVIEQLENEAANQVEFFTDDYRDDYYRGAYAAYCYAIEIVKKGGRNDK